MLDNASSNLTHSYSADAFGPHLLIVLNTDDTHPAYQAAVKVIDELHDGALEIARGKVTVLATTNLGPDFIEVELQRLQQIADQQGQTSHALILASNCPSSFWEASVAAQMTSAHIQKLDHTHAHSIRRLIRKKILTLGLTEKDTANVVEEMPRMKAA